MKRRLRLAVICDAVEEGWRSMDYVAEMLVKHLQEEHSDQFETVAALDLSDQLGERANVTQAGGETDRRLRGLVVELGVEVVIRRPDCTVPNQFHQLSGGLWHAQVWPTAGAQTIAHD